MKFHYYLFALMLLASLILINGGITGKVASETCCTGANCAPENTCDHAKVATLSQPLLMHNPGPSIFVALLGFLILTGAIFMLYSRHKLRHKYV
jgi:hypothetical protein